MARRKYPSPRKPGALLLTLVLLALALTGATLAYLITHTDPAAIPAFTPGDGWVKYGDYYYYTYPVAPGQQPETPLIDSLTLTGSYSDADGGKQALEIMAEAIQSAPADALGEAWGVTITPGHVAKYQ